MNRGNIREDIISKIPEQYHEDLSPWIDDIEQKLGAFADDLNISSIDELSRIEDVRRDIEELKDGLF